MMRVTIDDDSKQILDEILLGCRKCKNLKFCCNPYLTRKDIIRSALMKFQGMDCTTPKEK